MKFVPQIVLECGRILKRGVKPKTASVQKYSSGFYVTVASVAIEPIVGPLNCTQLVCLTATKKGLLHQSQ